MQDLTEIKSKAALLDAQAQAAEAAKNLHAAYWLADRDHSAAVYLLDAALSSFKHMADTLGYALTIKAETAE